MRTANDRGASLVPWGIPSLGIRLLDRALPILTSCDLPVKKAPIHLIKDGAYYCYCAYVLRISRYSDFLSVTLSNTGIFLRGLKLSGESRS